MSKDYTRLLIVLLIAYIVGLIVGHVFAILFLATLGCLIWQQQKLLQLLEWIRDPDKVEPPETPGVFDELSREIDRYRKRYKKRKKKLSGYLQQFQMATSALPDATVVLDDDDRIQWANRAAVQLLNIHWPQDQHQRITNLIRSPRLIDFLQNSDQEQGQTIEIKSSLDAEVYLSLRIVPYGKKQRLFVARDVTRIQRLVEIRKDFVANVSHELRTPLTVMRGYLDTLLQNREQLPEQWQPSVKAMSDQTNRMENVVNDLLMITRLEELGKVDTNEIVVVPEMVGRIHEEAVALSGDKRHLFEISIDPDLGLRGRNAEIYSAFSNLVFNAVRYTPDGGLIRIRWYADEAGAHFQVSDNGIGIQAKDIPRLTERFYRADQSRSREHGGSGLGLSIVKHVLLRHRAKLHIESVVEQGSTFRCDFPKDVMTSISSDKKEHSGQRI